MSRWLALIPLCLGDKLEGSYRAHPGHRKMVKFKKKKASKRRACTHAYSRGARYAVFSVGVNVRKRDSLPLWEKRLGFPFSSKRAGALSECQPLKSRFDRCGPKLAEDPSPGHSLSPWGISESYCS